MAISNTDIRITVALRDNATKAMRNMGNSFGKLATKVGITKQSLLRASNVALGLTAGLIALGGAAVKVASDFEQTRIAFDTMLGSGEDAKKLLEEIVEFATTTPFSLRDVQQGAKQLLAMGSAADEVIGELKMLGDVSAGLNVPIARLILNFGQVRTQGKLTGRELRDFAIAGVPLIAALQEVGDTAGKTKEQIADMVSAGDVSFETVSLAFEKMTSEGGKFEDLMDRQSKTLPGIFENIKDKATIMMGEIVGVSATGEIREGSIFAKLKISAEGLLQYLDDNDEKLVNFAKHVLENEDALVILAGAITTLLLPSLVKLALALGGIIIQMGILALPGALLAMAYVWLNKLSKEKTGYSFFEQLQAAVELVSMAVERLVGWFQRLYDKAREALGMSEKASKSRGSSGGGGGGSHQFGGIVPGPIGRAVPIIAHGGEEVIPTFKRGSSGSGSGGGGNITFNVYTGLYAGSELEKRNIAEMLYKKLVEVARTQNKSVEDLFQPNTRILI